jgi:hypothetical protein
MSPTRICLSGSLCARRRRRAQHCPGCRIMAQGLVATSTLPPTDGKRRPRASEHATLRLSAGSPGRGPATAACPTDSPSRSPGCIGSTGPRDDDRFDYMSTITSRNKPEQQSERRSLALSAYGQTRLDRLPNMCRPLRRTSSHVGGRPAPTPGRTGSRQARPARLRPPTEP